MRKFELVTGILAILFIILKFIFLEGFGLFITLSILVLSIFYLIFTAPLLNKLRLKKDAETEVNRKSNTKRIVGSIFVGFALSLAVIGILFKVQIWEGAAFQLYFSIISLSIAFIISLILYLGKRDPFYIRVIKRIVIIGVAALIFYLIPTTKLIDIYYRDKPEYAAAYKDWLRDPENPELLERMRELNPNLRNEDNSE